MPEKTMNEALMYIYIVIKDELNKQGIDDETIDSLMEDLLESIDNNVKWRFK